MFATQLTLPIQPQDNETFDSFYPGKNVLLIDAMRQFLQNTDFSCFYFWSTQSAGKTHLLFAACHYMTMQNLPAVYIPLKSYPALTTELFENIDNLSLVCLDDIETIAGNPDWETAIFDLFNRLTEKGVSKLLVTGNVPARQLPVKLPDLASRLNWGTIYQLHALSEKEKILALQKRSFIRGFELTDDIANYLLTHQHRDIKALFAILDELDRASIIAKRKLTLPFVRAVLSKKEK